MAVGTYIGGKVGVDVKPVTTGFYAELRRQLAIGNDGLVVPVEFDPDDARLRETEKRISGNDISVDVLLKGDSSQIDHKLDQMERQKRTVQTTLDAKIDTDDFNKSLKGIEKDTTTLQNKLKKMGETKIPFASIDDQMKQLPTRIDDNVKALNRQDGAWRKSSKQMDAWRMNLSSTGAVERAVSDKLSGIYQEQRRDLATNTVAQNDFFKSIDHTANGQMLLSDNTLKASQALREQRKQAADVSKQLTSMSDNLLDYQNGLNAFRPLGAFTDTQKRATELRKSFEDMNDTIRKNPGADVDFDSAFASYAKMEEELEKVSRDAAEANRQEVRVKFYSDGADKLQKEFDQLRRTNLGAQQELGDQYGSLISRWREAAVKAKIDPNFKFEADLDIDTRGAKKHLKDFKDDNDKLSMDLDMETAAASAHIAYLSRPRTVDIWADFKGTQGGQLIDDIIYGSTGLKGVQNKFDSLVRSFNNLDKSVPRLTMIGTALSDIGAGSLNLAGTIGGMGRSIIAMSKAAYAAPAALTGLGAALYGVVAAYKTVGDDFDVATTKLGGMQKKIGGAFWEQAAAPLRELANSIAPSLIGGLSGVASEEGNVAAGLAKMAEAADKSGQITSIFNDSRDAVAALSPGISTLVASFLKLGQIGGEYLPSMANYVSRVATNFGAWVDSTDRVQQVYVALQHAKEQAGYFKDSIGDLGRVIGGVFGAVSRQENGLQGFSEAVKKAADVVNGVQFQGAFGNLITGAQAAQRGVRGSFGDIGESADSLSGVVSQVMGQMGNLTGRVLSDVARLASGMRGGFSDFATGATSGVGKLIDSVSKASPMFSSLITMAGQLADTFGGTFAATLQAAAPAIKALAQATQGVSKLFSSLPEPIQAAIGLWATFGRAGMAAFNGLKTALLNNIQSTLKMQSSLAKVGLSADKAKVSVLQLAEAWGRLQLGQSAGLVADLSTGFNGVAQSAEKTGTAVASSSKQLSLMADGAVLLGSSGEKATKGLTGITEKAAGVSESTGKLRGTLGKLGGVASGAWAAMGGFPGIALMAGVTAAGAVWSSYNAHLDKARETQANFNQMAAQTPASLLKVTDGLNKVQDTVKGVFSQKYDFWDIISGNHANGFENAQQSISALPKGVKKSFGQISDITTGSKKDFDKYIAALQKAADEGTKTTANIAGGEYMNTTKEQTAAATASENTIKAMNDARDAYRKTYEERAKNVGMSKEYVDSLMDEGEAAWSVSVATASAGEKQTMLARGQQEYSAILDDQRNAHINAAQAASQYGAVQASLGKTIQHVQQLAAQGQAVWDTQAKSFDYSTEAGRTASDSLTQLANSQSDVISTMTANGSSLSDVQAKQKSFNDEIYNTTLQMTGNKDAAAEMVKQYGLTPEKVKTQFEADTAEAQMKVESWLMDMSAVWPNKQRTAIYSVLLNALTSGKKDVGQLNDMVGQLADGKHTVVLDANGDAVVTTVDEAEKYAKKGTDGIYRFKFDTDGTDALLGKLDEVAKKSKDVTQHDVTLMMNASGDAMPSIENIKTMLEGLGLKPTEIDLLVSGKAGKDLDAVKAKLEALGYTPEQITVIMNALDGISGPAANAKKSVDDIPDSKTSTLNGVNGVSPPADQAKKSVEAIPQDLYTLMHGDNQTGPLADSAKKSVTDIPSTWQSTLNAFGNTQSKANDAAGAINQIPYIHNTTMNGGGNAGAVAGDVNSKIRAIPKDTTAKVNGSGNAGSFVSGILNNLKSIAGQVWQAMVRGNGVGKAGGGRIYGPGTTVSDSIPAFLSNQEFVIKAASVKKLDAKYGQGFLNRLNQTGQVPNLTQKYGANALNGVKFAFANGGRVSASTINVDVSTPAQQVDMKPLEEAVSRLENTTEVGLQHVEQAAASGITIRDFERWVNEIGRR